MLLRARASRAVALVAALGAAAACTESAPTPADPGSTSTAVTSPSASGQTGARPPEVKGSGPTTSPSDAVNAAEAPPDQPLVVAVHHTNPLRAVSLRTARRLVAGRTTHDLASGTPREGIRVVVRDPARVAVVPAHAVGPEVRAVTVAGVDPLRRPDDYPLRTPAFSRPGPVVTVTVVGDVMLGRGVAEAARGSGDPVLALRPTARRLRAADVTVGNLEGTLSRAGAPTQGGDSFAADPAVASGLRDVGFDVLGLANNHVGDFGDRALTQTVRLLRTAGLQSFGAGGSERQAWQPAVVRRHGVRIGFIGFNAIGETPAAGPGRPGAVQVSMPPRTGPLDRTELRAFLAAVRRLDRRVDAVVVMPHWGTQYTNRPEPVQRRVARHLVRAGADVVVGGHPHWLQGVEMVRGRLVAHSLGNFVFDMDFMRETQQGAFLELTFWGGEPKAAEPVPYVMDDRFAPRVVSGARGEQVLEVMRAASGPAHGGPR